MLDLSLGLADVLGRIGLAVLFGGLIGLERHQRNKPAGVRTMMLIALGSCVFVVAAEEVLTSRTSERAADSIARVLAGIIGGVGFLGAGVILRDAGRVAGMTTAAAIWVTAGLGVVCGLGEFGLALLSAAAAIATLVVVRFVEDYLLRGGARGPNGDKLGDGR